MNILVLKLASTNRETREQLKFFRDSGGNIVQHFPAENEPEKHKALKERITNLDMLAEDCPVEWIITKAALQEGWDCPFAYILVSLNNTGRQQSMTQLVGRVLRQPYAEKTQFDELNESYVFCLRRKASEITKEVKKALEQEGYEGDLMSVADRSDSDGQPTPERESVMRKEFRGYYREFDGKVYLPRFCVKQGNDYVALDYFRHLISEIDVAKFDYAVTDWNLSQELASAKDSFYRITLDQDIIESVEQRQAAVLETDAQVKSWLIASLSFDYYSYKQLRQIVERATQELVKQMPESRGSWGW